jgi:predicted DCC family thiol-disulfide oxidoreductase YuxK
MPANDYPIRMLFDGLCPLCSREASLLRRLDRHGRIEFEDIAAPTFDPARYGLTMEQVIASMHAVLPDGSVVRGVDVFARLYRAIGWRWLAAVLEFRPTRPLFDLGYRLFAKLRPMLSKLDRSAACGDRCTPRVPAASPPAGPTA